MAKSKGTRSFVGTAGWSIPKVMRDDFFAKDVSKPNHLKAYAERLTGIEINSSFYKDHQASTYAKWAASTPSTFQFSIKLAKRFTHLQKLNVESKDLREVLGSISELGKKLGVILIQLPPKLAFDSEITETFFGMLRELYEGGVAVEPRHTSWAEKDASKMLEEFRIARVQADPDRIGKAPPIRSADLCYFRLHGSPKVYYSDYEALQLKMWSDRVKEEAKAKKSAWCIFDNTALGFATANALEMQELLADSL